MKSLIGKEWRDAADGSVIEVKNPATNELIDTVPSLSENEVKGIQSIKFYDEYEENEKNN